MLLHTLTVLVVVRLRHLHDILTLEDCRHVNHLTVKIKSATPLLATLI